MRLAAYWRLRLRRARWFVFFVGTMLSTNFLLAFLMPEGCFRSPDFDQIRKFLILNPPAALPLFLFGREDSAPFLFATSLAWWLFIAILFRRRHARSYETAFV